MLPKINLALTIVTLLFLACGCENKKTGRPITQSAPTTIYELDPGLKVIDSAVVIFYKDPYGPDSTRYTRYYTQASVNDPLLIKVFDEQLEEESIKEVKRHCRGEGKIWCYSKGKIRQTIYFSTHCNDCCFVYLIRDGNFYYSKILPAFTNWLNDLKKKST